MRMLGVLAMGVGLVLIAAARSQDAAKQDDAKKLEGLWVLEEGEQNGKSFGPRQGEEAIYIEGKSVLWTNKTGTNRSGQTANIKIDPSKNPKTMDFLITRGSGNGHKMLGIYKLEGDKLVLAYNNLDEEKRPSKFTTKLAAGRARALEVRTYVRAKE